MGETEYIPGQMTLRDWQNSLADKYAGRHPEDIARLNQVMSELNLNADSAQYLDDDQIRQLNQAVEEYMYDGNPASMDRISTLLTYL